MAVNVTYDPVLSRMVVVQTGGLVADLADFKRSADGGINWVTVRGGADVPLASGTEATVYDYEFPVGVAITYRVEKKTSGGVPVSGTSAAPVTQDLDDVWLKVPAAPYLNRPVTVSSAGDRTRPARRAVFDIVGRSNPVAVSDIRSSLSFEVRLRTFTLEEEETLDYTLQSGEILFFHLPSANKCMPGGYYSAGDVIWGPPGSRARPERIFAIPLTGVAAPGADVVATTYTWTSVLADYATWTDVLAANASWSALLARTGTPSDVVVP